MHLGLRPVFLLAFALLTAVDLRGAIVPVAIPASTRPDFNGDGKDDLAVGVPGENTGAGGVHIIYGSKAGLAELGDQFFTQNSPDIPGSEEDYDICGSALAAGDFNGDGYADLAFGCPSEDTPASQPHAGAVIVLYGSSVGLKGVGSQFWSQNSPGINGGSETLDHCGASLASGDINRDGFADLVWGCPGEDVGTLENAGAVNVLFGSAAGLTATGNRFLTQDSPGIPDVAEADDRCGQAVTVADFNNDGKADIAWGCPGEDIGLINLDAGAVSVAFGIASGISGATGIFLTQESAGGASFGFEGVEAFDKCGQALAAGDIDDDGFADLAFGCPGEDMKIPFAIDEGYVHVVHGGASGFTQGPFRPATGHSRCGAAVTMGDFRGDGGADWAYGCTDSNSGAGVVQVWSHTTSTGYSLLAELSQNSFGIPDANEPGDSFGHALTTGDFDGDGVSDLVVGAPNEDLAAGNSVGAVTVIYFPLPALDPIRSQFFHQDAAGIVNAAEQGDQFGFALSNSSQTPLPGLTGQWGDLTPWCRGASCGVTGTFTAINPSLGPTPRVALRFYLSEDGVLDDADVLIDVMPVKPLDMNESQVRKLNVVLPKDVNAAGRFVIAFVDADNIVEESNETNNVVVSPQID